MSASPISRPVFPEFPSRGAVRTIRRAPPEGRALDLVGRDLSRVAAPKPAPRRRGLGLALALGLVAALAISAFRMQIIHLRYELARAVALEQTLDEQERQLRVQVRELRDPLHLSARARELGLGRPERIVELPTAPIVAGLSTPR